MFYSKSTGGFFSAEIHGYAIPSDAVEISDEQYKNLIDGQSTGKRIVSDDKGYPVGVNPEPITQDQIVKTYENALDNHLDSVAKSDRWDNRFTFVARAAYPNHWQQKAIAFGTWMDLCNVQAYELMQEVIFGNSELPSIEDFIESLPKFVIK